ncbi:MAG: PIN domain-containing protein, partial [Candidatus Cryptobacteroides sp.]
AINILYFSNKYATSLRPDDISKLFQILPMDYEQFKDAQAIRIGDFENALQVECARKNNCKVIISRDSDLLNSDISYPIILSPEVFLKRYTE